MEKRLWKVFWMNVIYYFVVVVLFYHICLWFAVGFFFFLKMLLHFSWVAKCPASFDGDKAHTKLVVTWKHYVRPWDVSVPTPKWKPIQHSVPQSCTATGPHRSAETWPRSRPDVMIGLQFTAQNGLAKTQHFCQFKQFSYLSSHVEWSVSTTVSAKIREMHSEEKVFISFKDFLKFNWQQLKPPRSCACNLQYSKYVDFDMIFFYLNIYILPP